MHLWRQVDKDLWIDRQLINKIRARSKIMMGFKDQKHYNRLHLAKNLALCYFRVQKSLSIEKLHKSHYCMNIEELMYIFKERGIQGIMEATTSYGTPTTSPLT